MPFDHPPPFAPSAPTPPPPPPTAPRMAGQDNMISKGSAAHLEGGSQYGPGRVSTSAVHCDEQIKAEMPTGCVCLNFFSFVCFQ